MPSHHEPGNVALERSLLAVAAPILGDDGRPVLQRVLIANRGEIACRIVATCRKLNVTSIAIYVEEDKGSLHVQQADEAVSIGSIHDSEGGNPFLNIKLIIDTALRTKAQAIHPGYGYLSENPDFADAVRDAGIVFMGPSALAMSTLGNKRSSKVYLKEHAPEVPLIPGFSGSSQSAGDLENAAQTIGLPIMLKASSGGGGKGMRIVKEIQQLKEELQRAQSEAQRSFGDADIILEKYIEAGKHVEIQIVGDRHGKVVCLHERDCSVQRRHQKIIEETPCPWLTPDMRKIMGATAVRIAELIGYEGAGTVEFVVDVTAQKFYFLEVNARLQVEHPITEEVTGWDIVSLQFYVAAGGRLSEIRDLQEVRQYGHAIECRLCAEDPQKGFFPEHGTIDLWHPASPDTVGINKRDIRYETAVQTGSEVSIHFDSMIAKIVVWAPTRPLAIEKMTKVLANSVCAGVRTNQLFMQSCLQHPAFHNPAYTTSIVPENLNKLLENPYSRQVSEIQRPYGLIPSLFVRHLRQNVSSSSSPQAFRYIRTGFRNQRFDPINRHANVFETVAEIANLEEVEGNVIPATLVEWQSNGPQGGAESSDGRTTVHISSVPNTTKVESSESSISQKVTARYNAISKQLRTTGSGDRGSKTTYHVALHASDPISKSTPSHISPTAFYITASINNAKIHAYIILPSTSSPTTPNDSIASQKASSQLVLVHFPSLGTWATYKIYSLLSYAEKLRDEFAKDELVKGAGGLKTAVSPMPCKVLKILKKEGEEVKAGESVMVVESMKMEISISLPVGGRFKTNRKEGDTVDEGVYLCEVE